MAITFADLFSGIGGFHAVASTFGWKAVYACDIDQNARDIYAKNWNLKPNSDIQDDASDHKITIPSHDVLFAGFPCQPFSKSGKQNGMDEARGTLFWNIAKVLETRKPKIVILENVPNLAGPRHRHEWEVIIRTLRSLNYRVSDEPFIISPHQLDREAGGRPQNRPRIYLAATYIPKSLQKKFSLYGENLEIEVLNAKNSEYWNLIRETKKFKLSKEEIQSLKLTEQEIKWLKAWDQFLKSFPSEPSGNRLPGFPIWADVWLGNIKAKRNDPIWKKDFILKNEDLYKSNKKKIDSWLKRHKFLKDFPPSRRKFEWQAGKNESVFDCLIQFRPSGIRVKKPNYAPSAVAINQTSIVGPLQRRLAISEVAYLQGLPSWFEFHDQSESISYKQLGNGISVGASYQTIKSLIKRDREILKITSPSIVKSVENSPRNPDVVLKKMQSKYLL